MFAVRSSSLAILSLSLPLALGSCMQAAKLALPPDKQAEDLVDGDPSERITGCADSQRVKPLVIDWAGDERSDLAEVLSRGIAVVKYDCEQLEVLIDCSVEGDYAFVPTALDEYVLELDNGAEVRANLPVSGVKVAAGLGVDERIDIGFVSVGKDSSGRATVAPTELRSATPDNGGCAGATHFVRGVYRGSFAVKQAKRSDMGADIEQVFTAGSHASRVELTGAGKRDACQASTDAARAPVNCDVPLRLELRRLEADDAQAHSASVLEAVDAMNCPADFVERSGRCVPASDGEAFACNPLRPSECETQCERGNFESCGRFAFLQHYGRLGVARDVESAVKLYQRACDAKVPFACAGLSALYLKGDGGLAKDETKAVQLATFACERGDPRGCNNLGVMQVWGVGGLKADIDKSLELFRFSCDAGWPSGCASLGDMYRTGNGVEQDMKRAIELFEISCNGHDGGGCNGLGALYLRGEHVPQDADKACELFVRSCEGDYAQGCDNLGQCYSLGMGKAQDLDKAKAAFGRACELGFGIGCNHLKELGS